MRDTHRRAGGKRGTAWAPFVCSLLVLVSCSTSDGSGAAPGGQGGTGGGETGGSGGQGVDAGPWPDLPDGGSDAAASGGGGTGGTSQVDSGAVCPCLDGVDNYCLYFPHDIAGCEMLLPGGYCDPNGDGDFADADWIRGFNEYAAACSTVCGDEVCSAPSENCETCEEDCGPCAAGCGDGTCNGSENCLSCPQDCPKGASVACSKLGAHNIADTGPFYDFLGGCPRIAKWVGGEGSAPGTGFAQFGEMTSYKCACGGTTVLRVYGAPGNYTSGVDLWNARYKFLESATPWQKAAVDYLESDNECDAGRCWFQAGDPTYSPSVAAMQDYATFLSEWIDQAVAHGFKPLVGNFSVGSPGGDMESCAGSAMLAFGAMVPTLIKARDAGGGWAYHAYTDSWGYDATVGMMPYLAFRYRKLVACLPELATVPLIFTEAGFDKGGNAQLDGYLANGGWSDYGPWLAWFESEIAKDSYVRGALLYTFAPPGVWESFRLDDHAGELRGLLGAPACTP